MDPTDLQKYHRESPEDTCLEVRDSKIVSPKEGRKLKLSPSGLMDDYLVQPQKEVDKDSKGLCGALDT